MGPAQTSQGSDNGDAAKKRAEENRATLERAKKGYTAASNHMHANFKAMAGDLEMVAGGERQWDKKALQDRKLYKRPIVTSDRLAAPVKQVVGEVYKSRPSIRCAPADGAASPQTAEALEGIIRSIEHASGTQTLYPMIVQSAAQCGLGHARLSLQWSKPANFKTQDDVSRAFETELRISLIPNQFAVLRDPEAKEPQQGDAKWCLVVSEMDQETFKETYPDAGAAGWAKFATWATLNNAWRVGSKITIAEWWEIKLEPAGRAVRLVETEAWFDPTPRWDEQVGGYVAGGWVEPSGAELVLRIATPEDEADLQEALSKGFTVVQERELFEQRICMHLLGGESVLSGPFYWPGQRIPIFTCEGEVSHLGEERIVQGLIRRATSDQRRLNLALSSDLELTEMAPKNPFLVQDDMIADYEDEWVLAAQQPAMYLRYKAGANGSKPERMAPISANTGPQSVAMNAIDGIKATSGFSDASLGQRSNETSGVAIDARDEQSDTGAYVYGANLSALLQAIGQEIINVAPIVMKDRQMVAILGEDDTPAILDMARMRAEGRALDIGKYQAICNQGVSYQTQRDKENDLLAKMADALGGQPAAAVPMIYLARNMQMKNVDEFVGDLVAVLGQGGIMLPSMAGQPAQPGMPGAGMPPGPPMPMPPPDAALPPNVIAMPPRGAPPPEALAFPASPTGAPAFRRNVGDARMGAAPPGI